MKGLRNYKAARRRLPKDAIWCEKRMTSSRFEPSINVRPSSDHFLVHAEKGFRWA